MCRIILSIVAPQAQWHFSTLSHKHHDFRRNMSRNIKLCFDFLDNLGETFFILRRIRRNIITNVHRSSRKVPVIHARLEWNWNLLDRFSKNTQISIFMKIRPVGAELFHADWCRHDEDNSRFSQLSNAPIKEGIQLYNTLIILNSYAMYNFCTPALLQCQEFN
jgi:hypothetical protein